MRRYDHYERVVRWDRRNRFPERQHETQRPGVEKRTRMWGRKEHGFALDKVAAATSARTMRTGRRPKVVTTKRSVAERRLKEGDPVGVMRTVRGKEAYRRREHRRIVGLAEMRPFAGLGRQGKGAIDSRGKVTFHLSQPGVRRPRLAHYEDYYPLVTGAKGGQQPYRSRETGATSMAMGRALLEGRRRPRTKRSKK